MTLDDFDLAILRCLQESTRLTSEEIGEKVGLSATACQRRIKRLRETGCIASEVAILSPKAMGERTTFIVQVMLERGGADIIDGFRRDMARVPEVQQVFYVTGDCDFVLIVTTASVPAYEALTRQLFFDNPKVRKFNTTLVMETMKSGLKIPL